MEIASKIENFFEHIKDYTTTRIDLLKLQISEKTANIIASVVTGIIIFFLSFFILLFGSVALALGISSNIGVAYSGFLIVALLYLVIAIFIWILKDRWIKAGIFNALIRNFLKEDKHHE